MLLSFWLVSILEWEMFCKAALSSFITMNPMTVYTVKGVACTNQSPAQFPLAPGSMLASFHSSALMNTTVHCLPCTKYQTKLENSYRTYRRWWWPKAWARWETILYLYSSDGHKHDSKGMLMLLCMRLQDIWIVDLKLWKINKISRSIEQDEQTFVVPFFFFFLCINNKIHALEQVILLILWDQEKRESMATSHVPRKKNK